mgnify:CR=1 FL=1
MKKVLFVGESWSATLMEVKGFNSFLSSKYETGLGWIDKAIEKAGYEFVYMPNHIANDHFPFTLEELNEYSCIILSDVGADTLLIPSATFGASKILPNRCQLLKEYVLGGGGLLMIGGYLTFNGVGAQGKWWATPVQDVLPVEILPYDDRMEHCEGVKPVTVGEHEALKGIPTDWPEVLGYNKVIAKPEAEVPVTVEGDPFIAFASYGKGRSGVVTTDCAPHWAPPEFCEWEYYNKLWQNIADWLIQK